MDNTLYVGLSRQITLRRELDIVANNIANVDTAGFKLESLLTRAEEGRPARTLDAPGWVRFAYDDGVARNEKAVGVAEERPVLTEQGAVEVDV